MAGDAVSTPVPAAAGGGLDDSCELHHLLNLPPAGLARSRPWKCGGENTDTRPKRTRPDKESLIVCVLYCDNAEGKGESLAPSSKDFLQGWFGSEERSFDFFFSFQCLGCSEPVLYRHECRMQADVSLGRYVDICTRGPAILRLSPLTS